MTQLTKQSSETEIKAYFAGILNLSRSNEEFPVNLDDVWPLVYTRRDKAIGALDNNVLFLQGVDYQVNRIFPQMVENSESLDQDRIKRGRPMNTYMLSVPCLEFFIARKVRSVFEVYRQVFHKVAGGELVPSSPNGSGNTLEEALAPLAQYHAQVMARWHGVGEDAAREACDKHFRDYRADICKLVCAETIARLDGREVAVPPEPVAASPKVVTPQAPVEVSYQATTAPVPVIVGEELTVRRKVDDVYKIINWVYFSSAYMGRTHSWLCHKFANRHNGKPFPFKDGERVKFKFALVDISNRIRRVADRLSTVFHPTSTEADAPIEKPILVTDMKRRTQTIMRVISWTPFAKAYFNTSSRRFNRKMEGINGKGGVGGFNELETDLMCASLIDLSDRIRRVAESI